MFALNVGIECLHRNGIERLNRIVNVRPASVIDIF